MSHEDTGCAGDCGHTHHHDHHSDAHHHDHHGEAHHNLSHLPADAEPAVFAARTDIVFAPPLAPDAAAGALESFLDELAAGLASAGCFLVGHVKGSLAAQEGGALAFHLTSLERPPQVTGDLVAPLSDATFTINAIVFGVPEEALPDLVNGALAATSLPLASSDELA